MTLDKVVDADAKVSNFPFLANQSALWEFAPCLLQTQLAGFGESLFFSPIRVVQTPVQQFAFGACVTALLEICEAGQSFSHAPCG